MLIIDIHILVFDVGIVLKFRRINHFYTCMEKLGMFDPEICRFLLID